MSQKYDITLKEKTYEPFDELHFEISGKDVNYVLINTLRRIILLHIPTYAVDEIIFSKNTSIYNNDYMKIRLSNFPITNIKNNVIKLYNNIRDGEDINDKIDKLEIYLEKKNDTSDVLSLTTDDAIFYHNEKKIKSIYPVPLLITNLKENEEIQFTMKVNVGIGDTNIKYSPVSICCYEEIDDNKYLFKIEANKQLNEYELLSSACEITIVKLQFLLEQVNKLKDSDKDEGFLELENEDHTLGNLITYYLQSSEYIIFAGYKMDHLLIKNVIIRYKTTGIKNINEILKIVINEIIQLFKFVNSKFIK